MSKCLTLIWQMKKCMYTKVERELDTHPVNYSNLELTTSRVMHLLLLDAQDYMRLLGGINIGLLVHSTYAASTQL